MTTPEPAPYVLRDVCTHGYPRAMNFPYWGDEARAAIEVANATGFDYCCCCLAKVPHSRMYLDVCFNCAPEAWLPMGQQVAR